MSSSLFTASSEASASSPGSSELTFGSFVEALSTSGSPMGVRYSSGIGMVCDLPRCGPAEHATVAALRERQYWRRTTDRDIPHATDFSPPHSEKPRVPLRDCASNAVERAGAAVVSALMPQFA